MTTDIDISPSTQPPLKNPAPLTIQAPPSQDSTTRLELPFTWEDGPSEADLGDRDTVFRFPAIDDPEPGTRRLLAMSLYATVLGLIGLAVGIRGVVAIIAGHIPGWYEPTLAAAGLACVALVVAAFLSIHRRVLPWLLLITAAAPLAAHVGATRAL